jgi:integrase
VERDRVLVGVDEETGIVDGTETALLWRAAEVLEAENCPSGPIVKLLLLTACRRDEIGALRWDEIRGDKLVFERVRTKNDEPHTVPLSPQAKAIIDGLPRIQDCPFVFSVTGKGPYTSWSLSKIRLDQLMRKFAIEDAADDVAKVFPAWRIQDLRRTAATILEALGTPLQVTEALLNHKSGSKSGIVGIYQRNAYAKEKREAVNKLGAHIDKIVRTAAPAMNKLAA